MSRMFQFIWLVCFQVHRRRRRRRCRRRRVSLVEMMMGQGRIREKEVIGLWRTPGHAVTSA